MVCEARELTWYFECECAAWCVSVCVVASSEKALSTSINYNNFPFHFPFCTVCMTLYSMCLCVCVAIASCRYLYDNQWVCVCVFFWGGGAWNWRNTGAVGTFPCRHLLQENIIINFRESFLFLCTMREKLLHDLVGWCEDWVCLFYEFVLTVLAALAASTFIFSMQNSVSVEVISHSCDKISMFLSYHYIIHGWLCSMWLHYVKCKLCILYVKTSA